MLLAPDGGQPTNVGVAGTTLTFTIPPAFRGYPLRGIKARQTAGDATDTTVEASSDSAVTAFLKRIAKFTGLSASADLDKAGPYHYETTDKVYVKLTPNAGSNNNYTVGLLLGPGV